MTADRLNVAVAFALSVLITTAAHAQLPEPWSAGQATRDSAANAAAGQPPFKSGVDLVSLDVCVKQRNGRPAAGLKPEDFLVLENDVPQQIVFFSAEGRSRLAVTLLVDSSHSMAGPRLKRARLAAAEFIGILRSDDLVEVISFNERANLRYALGTDRQQAKLSLNEISAGGNDRTL